MGSLGNEWIVVEVNGQKYALSARCVTELQDCTGIEIVAFPGCQAPVVGLFEHRDRVLPVIDTRLVLGDDDATHDDSRGRPRLAITQSGERHGAFMVDGVHTMIVIEDGQIQALDAGVSSSAFIVGVHSSDRFGEVFLLDAGACLESLDPMPCELPDAA